MEAIRALVVDDDPAIGEYLHYLLSSLSIDTIVTTSGRKALEAFRKKRFNLMVTDLFMDDGDGIETILKITRKYRIKSNTLKIIAITGCIEPGLFLSLAEKIGADAVFAKPIERMKFLECVRKMFPRREGK